MFSPGNGGNGWKRAKLCIKMKKALIVFVKNIVLGRVKSRLAKSVGDVTAFEVYKHLVKITENETGKLDDIEVIVYFSDQVIASKWPNSRKFVQDGADLGERLMNAVSQTFKDGFDQVICIGSDLPDLSSTIILKGFESLNGSDVVIGPAEDGGYYLIGMNEFIPELFENKNWSSETLLDETISELNSKHKRVEFLSSLNDIDTLEDLKTSSIMNKFSFVDELPRSDKSTL